MREPPDDSQSIVLKPEMSRLVALIGNLTMAVAVNVAVFSFGSQIHRFGSAWLRVYMSIALIPGFVIGIKLAVYSVARVLNLFNPVPVLTLTPGRIHLGETACLSWYFIGRCNSIRSLTIGLEGFERAAWTGKNTGGSAVNVFHHEILAQRSETEGLEAGTIEVTIAAGSMHSFKSRRNSVNWQLELVARIPRWPSVQGRFPIVVAPSRDKLQHSGRSS